MPRCLTTAMSHGDSRTTASIVGLKTERGRARSPASAISVASASALAACDGVGGPPQPKITRSVLSSPTASITPSDGMAADADQGPQLDSLLVAEVEHALEQAPRRPRLRRALGEADPLRHLDDAERGDLGRPAVGHARADADEVARRPRVRERQEDAVRGLAPRGRHQPSTASARAAVQRATR